MPALRVLHLVGSPTSEFYRDLSEMYARGCIDALQDPARYTFIIAHVGPDGLWRFPRSLDSDAIAAASPLAFEEAVARLKVERLDVALPQMFCVAGTTDYRALLELLDIPYLGNRPAQMAITADKVKARAIVANAGVAIPVGQVLTRSDIPTLTPPVVVKPTSADNSEGISLVTSFADYRYALDKAFAYSPAVLVEEYIELGREVRCGIVVKDGQLNCLPLEEYAVNPLDRIRASSDKLKRSAGTLAFAAKDPTRSWIVALDDPIVPEVWAMAKRCHESIGCRQYSLFDFRIDPAGRPWFLEAGLYCSFSPKSVISTMMAAAGTPLDIFFAGAIEQIVRSKKHFEQSKRL